MTDFTHTIYKNMADFTHIAQAYGPEHATTVAVVNALGVLYETQGTPAWAHLRVDMRGSG